MFNVTMYDDKNAVLFVFNNTVGPRVTMQGFSAPSFIEYKRSSEVNGVEVQYDWIIKPSNFIEEGDHLRFYFPTPVRFTDKTKCFGLDKNDEAFWL